MKEILKHFELCHSHNGIVAFQVFTLQAGYATELPAQMSASLYDAVASY